MLRQSFFIDFFVYLIYYLIIIIYTFGGCYEKDYCNNFDPLYGVSCCSRKLLCFGINGNG